MPSFCKWEGRDRKARSDLRKLRLGLDRAAHRERKVKLYCYSHHIEAYRTVRTRSEKVEKRKSDIAGIGLFAKRGLKEEWLVPFTGTVYECGVADLPGSGADMRCTVEVSPGVYIDGGEADSGG